MDLEMPLVEKTAGTDRGTTSLEIFLGYRVLSIKVVRLHSTGYLCIANNQSCVPVNPEVGRKISYIEV